MQRRLSNGKWMDMDEDREEHFVNKAADFQGCSTDEIRSRLDAGEEIRFRADDWYPYIRIKPQPQAPKPRAKMIRADCGHSVSQSQVMRASMGMSCPGCYDRMSD